jgi:hypothetical protein
VTRDELTAAIAARTGLDATNQATLIQQAINDAYQEIVGRFHMNPFEVTLTLTANQDSYSINTLLQSAISQQDFYGLIELYYSGSGGTTGPLEQVDISSLVRLRASLTATGQPTQFAIVGFDGLELVQTPVTSTDQLIMWYDRWRSAFDNLTAGGQVPTKLPTPYHDLIDLRASLQLASRYESMGENRSLKADIAAEFDRRSGEFVTWVRNHQGKQTRKIKTGYRQFARLRPSVPSQDLGGRW